MDRAPRRTSFWARQVTGEPTRPQRIFDVLFGVVLPVVCLAADPIVFKTAAGFGRAVLLPYATAAYTLIGLQLVALAAWLLAGGRLAKGAAWFAGPLAAGAIIAAGVGLAILPISLIGLLVLIGALGFTPFLTSFVFLRNALRARARARAYAGPSKARWLLMAGVLCAVLPAVAVDRYQYHAIERLLAHPEEDVGWGARLGLVDGERIVDAYVASPAGARRDALARLYRRLTGGDIEDRLAMRND
jgi:hypothetical protein